jgi:aconitase family protein (aconitate hydratase)
MITVPTYGQAVNDENGEVNVAFDHDHQPMQPAVDTIPVVAKKFKGRGQPWALIVDENYGEGSAREHAALQPRFYGRIVCPITLGLSLTISRLCNDNRAFVRPYSRNQFEGMTFISH